MIRRSRVACFVALSLIGTAAMTPAADVKTGAVQKTFKNDDGTESPYVVYVPKAYDGTTALPVILFLHGSGETKGGAKMPFDQGLMNKHYQKQEEKFPAIVVVPQSEKRTWKADSADAKRALAMLDATTKEYKTDPARVYLTGLSMGGYGTWSLAVAHPEKWAAIVPVCGGGDPKAAEKIKDIPCWCFHGDKDDAVKVEKSREMIEALKKAGGDPKYTEYAGVGHNSWDRAYDTDELYTWLFAQKKK
ncbi:prolyl oligopeptidase family serine peptidase [Fimbriiglobus ruber]|uniref:Dienelactone hydrolase domain-containing protein n=1 Tax=Fimbriiglobus ruber TaxID=1908690 RepID=A0A225DJM4_9BACT|nr:prolyl oligopeptidase family serine peptidase [Fimbriiglobus ruber]OWK41602.1 hypothetical protein FRUB_03680 [Fimbriiglobus ruber]